MKSYIAAIVGLLLGGGILHAWWTETYTDSALAIMWRPDFFGHSDWEKLPGRHAPPHRNFTDLGCPSRCCERTRCS